MSKRLKRFRWWQQRPRELSLCERPAHETQWLPGAGVTNRREKQIAATPCGKETCGDCLGAPSSPRPVASAFRYEQPLRADVGQQLGEHERVGDRFEVEGHGGEQAALLADRQRRRAEC